MRLLPLVVLMAAAALRVVPLLARYPLHRDEALYGAWAQLIAKGIDPLLLTAWVDKPPLVIYFLAGSLRGFGASELALRLPGMVASVACVALVYGMAQQVYGRRSAIVASILCAASPFAILFAPTAFTDPWLTVWLLASAWAALAGKPFWTGILLGLAIASKQQGVFAVPLVLSLMAVQSSEGESESKSRITRLRGFLSRCFLPALAGFALIFIPLTYWDSLRWAKRPSFWGRSLDTYGGVRVAGPEEWFSRLGAWARQTRYLFGGSFVTTLFLGLAMLPGILAIHELHANKHIRLDFPRRVDFVLSTYVLGYLALHVVVTFQPWDRYLLPILPLIAVMAARGLVGVWEWLGSVRRNAAAQISLAIVMACLVAWGSWMGVSGRLPVGSDHGAFDNLGRVVEFVQGRPPDALVYQHSLGWYLDFYLPDAPQERPWWENTWKLADLTTRIARLSPGREQWLVLTESEESSAESIRSALSGWGLTLREEQAIHRRDQTRAFTIYHIVAITEHARR